MGISKVMITLFIFLERKDSIESYYFRKILYFKLKKVILEFSSIDNFKKNKTSNHLN